jgi:hypothetical protein
LSWKGAYFGGETVSEYGKKPIESDCLEIDAETLKMLMDPRT